MPQLYLLLGSNKGNRTNYLFAAKKLLQNELGNCIAASSIYETAAWGNEKQAAFLNQALLFETNLLPEEILHLVKNAELLCGRTLSERWGEREIDIDILLLGNTVFNSEKLNIPHIYLYKRKFALLPLSEIAGNVVHPVFQKNIQQLLAECDDTLEVVLFNA